MELVLASGSPRRRQLLTEAGYEFDVILPAVDEVSADWLTIREATACNAMRKAVEVAQNAPKAVVLGADTLVTLDGCVIGKPIDLDDAAGILRRLSGRVHEVWTSVFVCRASHGGLRSFRRGHEITRSREFETARKRPTSHTVGPFSFVADGSVARSTISVGTNGVESQP